MIDHYSMVEAAVMDKLRTIESLFPHPWQVLDDESNIRKGANYFAVFFPSTFTSSRANGVERFVIWNCAFDLYVRFTTKKESLSRFRAARAELFVLLNSKTLPGAPGVFDVSLNAASEVLQDIAGDNPNFIIQTFNAAVSQKIRFIA